MLSLPNLAPSDSYTLWYTSSHNSHNLSPHIDDGDHPTTHHGQNNPHRRQHPNFRTPLARLRLDEEYMERRKLNVQNYGNSWIKPPGIPKSLQQLREEKREMEEHQEAIRREALAQELAEAEAAEGIDDMLQGEGMDGDIEEAVDLDDDVPDAETTGLGGDDDEDEDEDEDSSDDTEEIDDAEELQRGVLASRLPDDVYREALVRGEHAGGPGFGDEGGSAIGEEDQEQMLREEDLVHESRDEEHDVDMDMDADLDADVPEAGGYEHTDTEAELTSSSEEEDESEDESLSREQAAASMVRSDGTQNSMDLSNLLSQGSSSPQPRSGLRGHRGH